MNFLSVCSGIEAASAAWHPLGWKACAFSEIEKFPSAVLSHHYPDTPNYGDMTNYKDWPDATFDVLVGGTPCQSFSIAGLRQGLADPRGNLMLVYLGLLDRFRPEWMVWENVPGVLSSNGGRDFGTFLGGLGQLGYGFAYRVLDAQYFGLAQRRKRVFVVGCLGDWRRSAAVLFEPESLSGHPAPRRETGQATAPTLSARTKSGGGLGTDLDCDGGLVAHTLRGEGFDASEDGTGRGTPLVPICFSAKDHGADAMEDLSPTLRAGGHSESHANAGVMPAIAYRTTGNNGCYETGDVAPCLNTGSDQNHTTLLQNWRVRRLTPRECERLQGFPDGYTAIPYRGKPAADGHRYKALGNSMAVPVMRWIGERMEALT